MSQFSIESLTQAILAGWLGEGFQDNGNLEKLARGVATGVFNEVSAHTVSIGVPMSPTVYSVFDPTSV